MLTKYVYQIPKTHLAWVIFKDFTLHFIFDTFMLFKWKRHNYICGYVEGKLIQGLALDWHR